MNNCANTGDAEGAVNFLRFNCDIWGAEGVDPNSPWYTQIGKYIRGILAGGRIQGFETPGAFLTSLWPYLFAIAGLILFGMLLWGSMEIMFGAATPKSAEAGRTRITHAIIGFVLLFSVFWIGQIIQQVFGLNFGLAGTP